MASVQTEHLHVLLPILTSLTYFTLRIVSSLPVALECSSEAFQNTRCRSVSLISSGLAGGLPGNSTADCLATWSGSLDSGFRV